MPTAEMTEFFANRRILITGAAGFVGSNLLRFFQSNSLPADIILKPASDPWRLPDPLPGKVLYSDMQDEAEVLRIMERVQPEIIFHLASIGGHPKTGAEFLHFHTSNTRMINNLLTASIKCRVARFVYCGSSLEAEVRNNKVLEDYALRPKTTRGITKATESLICGFYAENSDMTIINNRIFSVYGPWEQPYRIVPQLVMGFLAQRPVSLASEQFRRDYVFAEDVVRSLLMSAMTTRLKSGTIVNVGSGSLFSARDIYNTIKDLTGHECKITDLPFPVKEVDKTPYSADLTIANELLGWYPEHSLKDGLHKTIGWFKSNQTHYE